MQPLTVHTAPSAVPTLRSRPNGPTVFLPEGIVPFLKLIAEPTRLRLLALLAHGERCVCDIEAGLVLPQNLVSHHLAMLKREGLVVDRRAGKWVYYRLATPVVQEHLAALMTLLDIQQAEIPASPCGEEAQ